MAHSPEEIKQQIKVYWIIYVALMALTVVTVAVAQLNVSVGIAVFLALVVASFKGTLVACYFMHLLSEKAIIYWSLAITMLMFFILIFLPLLTDLDPLWGGV